MILLLFLASLAVLYYVVPVPEPDDARDWKPVSQVNPSESAPAATEMIATPGILALGRALDELGRGAAPQAAPDTEMAVQRVPTSG